MSLRGDLALSLEKIAVDRLSLEFNRQPLTGRFAYFLPSGNRPARVDAELTANQFDFIQHLNSARPCSPARCSIALAK